jgi:two-component system chemotaxis response regulator CheY
MKTMLIDDSTIMRLMLKKLLRQHDLTDIEEAGNGLEGIEILKNKPVDLILLDLHMPDLDGLGVLRILKNDDNLKDIPVIIVSSESEKEKISEGMKLGAASYVRKPFRDEEFKNAVSQALHEMTSE